ncbi:MAG: DEAD/DEAH box helicase, partial [Emcibacteraceae bacterium]|nr:DEAD/DEAH box helicase [Emcibacteraceae bacterium]
MTEELAVEQVSAPALTFEKFGFDKAIMKSIKNEGFETPTPIQDMAILPVMGGFDLMGIAQTGSGKTAAFSLPTINKLIHDHQKPNPYKPKALIIAPTRELVMQIGKFIDQFSRGTPIKSLVVAGGQPYQPQIRKLKYGIDILISTPGRLIDHMGSGNVKLEECDTFILDEADRMLDMGFIDEVKEIQSNLNTGHQTVMFSATMNDKVRRLSGQLLTNPEYVEQERKTMVAETITHKLMHVRRKDKTDLLVKLLEDESIDKALVFARTKLGADKLCDDLKYAFDDTPMRIDAIHGDKKQRTREKILMNYRKGRTKVLVATDVAARGIDVEGITHVINYELPIEAENYVHRVGRTGRAGQSGLAISFCDPSDFRLLREIERLIKMKVDVDPDHDYHFETSDV